jgi:hypothetical protein
MKAQTCCVAAALLCILGPARAVDDPFGKISDYLAVSAFHGNVRARLCGLADLEAYYLESPPPGLVFTDRRFLLNSRLTLFLDAQFGPWIYAFAQARLERGFDPSRSIAEFRVEEFALRISPWENGRLSAQFGKFGTVIGNWVPRHDSWANPFVTAPVPYENLTGMWDSAAPFSNEVLSCWGNVEASQRRRTQGDDYSDKPLRLPVFWGPSYASGAAISGRIGKVEYAAELKNASLSSPRQLHGSARFR